MSYRFPRRSYVSSYSNGYGNGYSSSSFNRSYGSRQYNSRRVQCSAFDNFLRRHRRVVTYRGAGQAQQNETQGLYVGIKPKPDDGTLLVESLDLLIAENTRAHHTEEFDVTEKQDTGEDQKLVVRRGQNFIIKVEFNRPYDEKKDDLKFVFSCGKNPKPTNRTLISLILSDKDEPKKWGAFIKSRDGNTITVAMTTPPTCFVGKWSFNIDVIKVHEETESVFRWEQKDPIYMLFNPWCKDDAVYMPDDHLLKEYILKDTGIIYVGKSSQIAGRSWVFGQFTGDVLDCCMYLLDKASIKDQNRGDPIQTARKLSAIINSNGDDGVLTGNWSGDYGGGTSPLAWSGSVDILEKYLKTKRPVEYGQCWVYSGVTTTVCRALGIPARSVTNFDSAHDTDGSITIDSHFDEKGNALDEMDTDSVWNFHVWNDVWMARPDLPAGYGGWQAIDATPQEESGGVMCMGPVSLAAIKRGEVALQYDAPFTFAEVNADRVYWIVNDDGTSTVAKIAKNGTGRCISTKSPMIKVRQDITEQYKFPEGTKEERIAVRTANKESTLDDQVYAEHTEDVEFSLHVDNDSFVGQNLNISLELKNTSSETRKINGTVTIATMYYTGVHYRNVHKEPVEWVILKPNEETSLSVTVPASLYMDCLMDHCMFKVSCLMIVYETKQTFAEIEVARLIKPDLTVKAPSQGKKNDAITVEVSFVNPLQTLLTSTELRVEGPGLQKAKVLRQRSVKPNDTFTASFEMKPAKIGEREIVICFNSDQISSLSGSHTITISK